MNSRGNPATPGYRVFIVDDHPMMRFGLTKFLAQEEGLLICGQAGNSKQALRLIPQLRPDLVVVDISLPDQDGMELIKRIRALMPQVKMVVHSMHDERIYAGRALRAGAQGYVMKQEGGDQLLTAIDQVLKGHTYLSARMSSSLGRRSHAKRNNGLQPLTDREMEILCLIGRGLSNKEIARQLSLSIKTVDAHREHIKKKMGLKTSIDLNLFAVRWVESDQKPKKESGSNIGC